MSLLPALIPAALAAGLPFWLASAAGGATLGALHFGLLRWNTALYLGGGRLLLPLAVHGARLCASALALYAAIRGGLSPLALAAGLLAARQLCLKVAP